MNVMCGYEDCKAPGKVWPTVLLWARGYKPGDHEPMRMQFGVAICADHMASVTVDSLVPPEARLALIAQSAIMGKRAPRFDNAQIEWSPVGDDEWNSLHLSFAAASGTEAGNC